MYLLSPCAKVNVHLDILGRRPDGRGHNLQSILQCVSLYDSLFVRVVGSEYQLTGFDVPLEKDLLYKAYIYFRRRTDLKFGLKLKLKKNIPVEAGLGGGSSDAASLLRFLNRHFGDPIPQAELIKESVAIGADVPFFVAGYRTALTSSLGEELEPLAFQKYFIVLMKPDLSISTARAFAKIDELDTDSPRHVDDRDLKESWSTGSFSNFFNAFSRDIPYPIVETYKRALGARGALFAEMSGSGSAVAGYFKDERAASVAFSELRREAPFVALIETT